MIEPALTDDALLADIAAARREHDRFHLWWLGQSGFLVHWQDRFALLDPYLSDSLTRKYAATDKPHVRMTRLVIAPERLGFIDVVTSSHHHTDHLDAETLKPLAGANAGLVMVCPEANRAIVRDRSSLPDARILGLDAAGPAGSVPDAAEAGPFRFEAVPAAHEALDTDTAGRHIYLGFVVRFGPWSLYHSGDTVRFPGMAEGLRPSAVDVAILPINGRAPERRVAGNLSGPEAAQLAHDIGAGCVIPCHHEMFEFNTAPPDAFEAGCVRLGQPFRTLRAGERWTSPVR